MGGIDETSGEEGGGLVCQRCQDGASESRRGLKRIKLYAAAKSQCAVIRLGSF